MEDIMNHRYEIILSGEQVDHLMVQELSRVLKDLEKHKPTCETDRVETKRDIDAVERVLFYCGG